MLAFVGIYAKAKNNQEKPVSRYDNDTIFI